MTRPPARHTALASLLLLIGVGIASGWYSPCLQFKCIDRYCWLSISCGGLNIEFAPGSNAWTPAHPHLITSFHRIYGEAAPVYIWKPYQNPLVGWWSIFIPFWIPALPLTGATAYLFIRRRRRSSNLCPKCSYNLAGLPPQSPCPECGKGVAA